MNISTIGRFLLGDAGAVKGVARDRAALWTGIILVLLTGIARNYDQSYWRETPLWLVGPLIFSFFSGSFLYWVLIRGFARPHFPLEGTKREQWTTFMALFWMTAPIAWLYAIPVERFLSPAQAAQANMALLGFVSLWRVLLMSRILSVLFGISLLRALGWVLVAASLEIIILGFFSGFLEGVARGMAGMRNAPDEQIVETVMGIAWRCSVGVVIVCAVLLVFRQFRGLLPPLPQGVPGTVPWSLLLLLAILWLAVAILPQLEQRRFVQHANLMAEGNYPQALALLANHKESDFPPGRRLEPNPYEHRVWRQLPPTIALLTPRTPAWIRATYLGHLSATLQHNFGFDSPSAVAPMLSALEKLPEGREWMRTNEVAFARKLPRLRFDTVDSLEPQRILRSNIVDTLSRMGMAATNVAKVP